MIFKILSTERREYFLSIIPKNEKLTTPFLFAMSSVFCCKFENIFYPQKNKLRLLFFHKKTDTPEFFSSLLLHSSFWKKNIFIINSHRKADSSVIRNKKKTSRVLCTFLGIILRKYQAF